MIIEHALCRIGLGRRISALGLRTGLRLQKASPPDPIFTTPPFIAIEIFSSEDRMSRIRRWIGDYLYFGVPYVCVIDPEIRKADIYTPSHFYEATELILRTQTPTIGVPLTELFQALDE